MGLIVLRYFLWEPVNGINRPSKKPLDSNTSNAAEGHLTSVSELFEAELEKVSALLISHQNATEDPLFVFGDLSYLFLFMFLRMYSHTSRRGTEEIV